jgi:hypothetical protein
LGLKVLEKQVYLVLEQMVQEKFELHLVLVPLAVVELVWVRLELVH